MTHILGISAYYHDSAAALIIDGRIIAAAQEERFTRRKHDLRFPRYAIEYCLSAGSIKFDQLDYVVFYDKPFLKFERLLETYLAFAPQGHRSFMLAMPIWLREKLLLKNLLKQEIKYLSKSFDSKKRLLFTEHHLSHAASAFYPSPFESAVVLTMDGVGEWATTSVGLGHGDRLEIVKEMYFPHSIGLLYSAFTHYAGFKVNSGEYKLMGLAPYGQPKYAQLILDNILDLKEDGTFKLDQKYFDYCAGLCMTSSKFDKLFGGPARLPDEPLTQHHMNLAASIQNVTEEIILRLTRSLAKATRMRNLCLAGGVALNCVANGKILKDGMYDRIWIQPAAGDAGGSLGAALCAYHLYMNGKRNVDEKQDAMRGTYLGPEFSQEEIEKRLEQIGAKFVVLNDEALIDATSNALINGRAVGWFQGRMEFGPRALGARSILGDARSATMQSVLNRKVKFRESFRPFAPSVLREHVADWFELDNDSPYMLLVADVANKRRRIMTDEENALFGIEKLNVVRSDIPAVTHVDYSARIQTVNVDTNPRYHALLLKFYARTGCPVIINTSFNIRGEPIVCTPEDAFRCFMGTHIESLAIGNCFLRKEDQDLSLSHQYQHLFELD